MLYHGPPAKVADWACCIMNDGWQGKYMRFMLQHAMLVVQCIIAIKVSLIIRCTWEEGGGGLNG